IRVRTEAARERFAVRVHLHGSGPRRPVVRGFDDHGIRIAIRISIKHLAKACGIVKNDVNVAVRGEAGPVYRHPLNVDEGADAALDCESITYAKNIDNNNRRAECCAETGSLLELNLPPGWYATRKQLKRYIDGTRRREGYLRALHGGEIRRRVTNFE